MAARQALLDASFAHASMTPDYVRQHGGIGVMLYGGCDATAKNTTGAEIKTLVSAGLWVGLVIENGPTDLRGGAPVGMAQGQALAAFARQTGYVGVGFCSADYDVPPADYPAIEAAMLGFSGHYPEVCGLYSNSGMLDYLHARHPQFMLWQSASDSFSTEHPTPYAHLWQRVPPQGMDSPYFIDEIYRTPIGLMGEPRPKPPGATNMAQWLTLNRYTGPDVKNHDAVYLNDMIQQRWIKTQAELANLQEVIKAHQLGDALVHTTGEPRDYYGVVIGTDPEAAS